MRESEGKSAGRSVRLTAAPVNAELPRFLAGSQAGALPPRKRASGLAPFAAPLVASSGIVCPELVR